MGLKDYRAPTETVELGGATFAVQGLSATAISAIIRSQGPVMEDLYVKALNGEFDITSVESLLGEILDEAPLLVGLVIAFGVGEPEEWSSASEMAFADQVILLDAIIRVTLSREGSVGKVVEIIKGAMRVAAPAETPSL